MTMDRSDWLNHLNVNDEIAIEERNFGTPNYRITKIIKITPARQFVVEYNNMRFGNDGIEYRKHEPWNHKAYLVPIDDEVKSVITRTNALTIITTTKFESLSTEKLLKIIDIIQTENQKTNKEQ